jgi:dTDP-4-dehydrorhamnose reductase
MRVLIFGRTGQVARELARMRWPENWEIVQLGRVDCNLEDPQATATAIHAAGSEIVINAAAYTAVDRAEAEPQIAERVNRDAPGAIAAACDRLGAALIHLSTDYVFDGSKRNPYRENDPVSPISIYGRTKAEGESFIRKALPRHVIIRTSWVFAAHGANFVRTMLRLVGERPELRIVDDQNGAPTAARDIAGAIATVAGRIAEGRGAWGTFHFTSAEPTTWFGFAQAIFELCGRQPRLIPIGSTEYRTAAQRPLNSVLDCGRIAQQYGISQPSWRAALKDVLIELEEMAEPARAKSR